MSKNFTSKLANVYFTTNSNISKFQPFSNKVAISNPFKEVLMSKQLKSGRKLTNLAGNLRQNSFLQARYLSTSEVHNFHQRNQPGQRRSNNGDNSVAGSCYLTIVFAFVVINLVTFVDY